MGSINIEQGGIKIHIHTPDAVVYFCFEYVTYMMTFHRYCGPNFYMHPDTNNEELFIPNEDHPIWDLFEEWHIRSKFRR